MSLNFGLEDVHILVTGAAGGIGLETVKLISALGARVTAHYNSSIGELQSLQQQNKNIVPIQADVRKEDEVNRLVSEAASKNGGPVSILVINHGIWPTNDANIVDMKLSQWQNTIAVNLTGPFLLCKAYLGALRDVNEQRIKDTASIIFIGSTAGKFGEAGHGDYSATKSALMYGMVPTLKNEIVSIAPKGRVNVVSPGWVATPQKMAEGALGDKAFVERALATTPLQKVALPRDIASQVAVMASPTLSGHVSGMNIMVDGGMEGRLLFPSTL
ncbi:NAD(P)-binding protein [Polychaeton citri CBS 116435]|uniref:NAD(P)-binding protein n=1 Tax=Polychaeton citri CBS 116435 TaxID=1314669 RepID=A0A9P4QGR2_9PEZI|nr:NAD(P)-binding protein [Polychaeton citri CBS 116435]